MLWLCHHTSRQREMRGLLIYIHQRLAKLSIIVVQSIRFGNAQNPPPSAGEPAAPPPSAFAVGAATEPKADAPKPSGCFIVPFNMGHSLEHTELACVILRDVDNFA